MGAFAFCFLLGCLIYSKNIQEQYHHSSSSGGNLRCRDKHKHLGTHMSAQFITSKKTKQNRDSPARMGVRTHKNTWGQDPTFRCREASAIRAVPQRWARDQQYQQSSRATVQSTAWVNPHTMGREASFLYLIHVEFPDGTHGRSVMPDCPDSGQLSKWQIWLCHGEWDGWKREDPTDIKAPSSSRRYKQALLFGGQPCRCDVSLMSFTPVNDGTVISLLCSSNFK